MKKIIATILLLAICASAQTPFYYSSKNSDGTAQTNPVTFQAFPPTLNGFTIYGTNIIYGNNIITSTPSATGFLSNSLYPNQYQVNVPALGFQFFANIPDTTNYQSLALYMTNTATVSSGGSAFQLMTNYLGYTPAHIERTTNVVYLFSLTWQTNGNNLSNLVATFRTNLFIFP